MHVLDAASNTVDQYPGGAESLAPRVGLSAGILRNKVNPNCQTNHLTLAEADRIMTVTGDLQILQSLAANHNCAIVRVGDVAVADSAMTMILRRGAAEGDFTRCLHDALADGQITGNELSLLGRLGLAEQKAVISLVAWLQAAHEKTAGPAHVS
jgi:hypothetical protein